MIKKNNTQTHAIMEFLLQLIAEIFNRDVASEQPAQPISTMQENSVVAPANEEITATEDDLVAGVPNIFSIIKFH